MTICANGHQNPDGPKFCGECGVAIAGVPASCPNGHQNPDGRKFCGECGAATVAAPLPVPPAVALPPPSGYPRPTGNRSQRYGDEQSWGSPPTSPPGMPAGAAVASTGASNRRRIVFVLAASALLALAVPFIMKTAAACPPRGTAQDPTFTCIALSPFARWPYILGVLFCSGWSVAIGGAFAFRWGQSRAGVAVFAIGTVAISLAIAVIGVGDVHQDRNGSSVSSAGAQQAGSSVSSFCADLRNLWDGSVLQAIRDVDDAGRAGGTPNTSESNLQTAATNAQKLADDAPSGESGGGGDLKTELTSVAHILAAAAAGQPAHTVFDGQGVVEWQEVHCP